MGQENKKIVLESFPEMSEFREDFMFMMKRVFPIKDLMVGKFVESGLDEEIARQTFDTALRICKEILYGATRYGYKHPAYFDEDGEVCIPQPSADACKAIYGACLHLVDVPASIGGSDLSATLGAIITVLLSMFGMPELIAIKLAVGAAKLYGAVAPDEKRIQEAAQEILSGEAGSGMLLTEDGAGSAVGMCKTMAKDMGDYVLLTGKKTFISNADIKNLYDKMYLPVLARYEGDPEGTRGITLFMMPKFYLDENGQKKRNDWKVSNLEHKDGMEQSPTCTVDMGDNGCCVAYPVGIRCKGFLHMMDHMMLDARRFVGLQGPAAALFTSRYARKYAETRIVPVDDPKSSDKEAIIRKPDVKRMLAKMYAITDAIFGFGMLTANYKDMSEIASDQTKRNLFHDILAIVTPIMKRYCTYKGHDVCDIAMQILAGYGYMKEYPIGQYKNNVRVAAIYEGTNGMMGLDLLRQLGKLIQAFMALQNEISEFCKVCTQNPRLEEYARSISAHNQTLLNTAIAIQALITDNKIEVVKLHMDPFAELFGHVLGGYVLLRMAAVADEDLRNIYSAKNATTPEDEFKIRKDNSVAQHRHEKIQSLFWFVRNVMDVEIPGLAGSINGDNTSAMDYGFDLHIDVIPAKKTEVPTSK